MITAKFSQSSSELILFYNGGEAFYRYFSSLKQSNISSLEIIVVADGDTDGSGELACEFGAKVLGNSTIQAPAAARNRVGYWHCKKGKQA